MLDSLFKTLQKRFNRFRGRRVLIQRGNDAPAQASTTPEKLCQFSRIKGYALKVIICVKIENIQLGFHQQGPVGILFAVDAGKPASGVNDGSHLVDIPDDILATDRQKRHFPEPEQRRLIDKNHDRQVKHTQSLHLPHSFHGYGLNDDIAKLFIVISATPVLIRQVGSQGKGPRDLAF